MTAYICKACGAQYPDNDTPPDHCLICEDERQYVPLSGQEWVTADALRSSHQHRVVSLEAGLTAFVIEPSFAISQVPYLIESEGGNILWECNNQIDAATIAAINERGGLAAIAISHPHFYSSMVDWSLAFGGVPIYIHDYNRDWVMTPHDVLHFWTGDRLQLHEDITLIRCGGHFPGSSVLHWRSGAAGKGALLTGDTLFVVADRQHVSFMYSYPNRIPLSPKAVRAITAAIADYSYDRLYSSWLGAVIDQDAKAAVQRSQARYIRHVTA